MKNYYAKQYHPEVKVHTFNSMYDRDAWVQKHYEDFGARQCSAVEAKKLDSLQCFIKHSAT